jgi:hypothetical protein
MARSAQLNSTCGALCSSANREPLNILNSAQPKRVSQTDDKRMTLARENGRWRVTSGF